MDSTSIAESTPSVTYQDCILGKVGAPAKRKQKTIFQLMTMFSSVPITVTINWAIHAPHITWEAFVAYLYMYPLMLGIVASVRFLIANPVTEWVIKHIIAPRLEGLKKALSIALLNTLFMGTIVAGIRTLLVNGGLEGSSWVAFAQVLPTSFFIGFCFSYFFVSPMMKKVFIKKIEPRITDRGVSQDGSYQEAKRRLGPQKPVRMFADILHRQAQQRRPLFDSREAYRDSGAFRQASARLGGRAGFAEEGYGLIRVA